jgi:hypothetical protein
LQARLFLVRKWAFIGCGGVARTKPSLKILKETCVQIDLFIQRTIEAAEVRRMRRANAQLEHGYSIFIFVTFLDQASSSQAA